MVQLREVSQKEKIIFPIILVFLVGMMLPSAAPLIGMFCFGNLMRESLVVERLSEVVQNSLINIVTIFLGFGRWIKTSSLISSLPLKLLEFCR
jgi:oxaloacetate decarboxylase beta subunit